MSYPMSYLPWPSIQLPLLMFLVRYRRTALGPLWLLVGPSLFIVLLGFLFAEIGAASPSEFIPHLAIGLVLWTLIQGFVTGATTVFQRGRAQIMQSGQRLADVAAIDVTTNVLIFVHQVPIIIVTLLVYDFDASWSALHAIVGLAVIVANGVWTAQVFGILGARYRDLPEVFQALMRIAFLATPIIWMPGEGARGGVMGVYLVLNPFYHFIEVVRAPLLGHPVALLTWVVVGLITVIGFSFARFMMRRYGRFVPLWI